MNKVNLIFFSTHAYPLIIGEKDGFGGAELEIWNLSRAIAVDSRFDVSLVTVTNEIHEPMEVEGVTVVPVRMGKPLVSSMPRWERQVRLLGQIKRIFSAIFELKPDLTFTMLPPPHTLAAYYGTKLAGGKFVFRVAGDSEISYQGLKRIFPRRGAKQSVNLLRKSSIVFAQSTHQKEQLLKNFGVESQIVMNPHFIPEAPVTFYSVSRRKNALWIARANPLKRPQLFLDLAEQLSSIPCVLIMPKVEAFPQFFDDMTARASEISNINFIPGVSQTEINAYYMQARVFILTSEIEGFSNVVIEALKNGVPVVSLLHNPNGILTPISQGEDAALGFCADGDFEAMKQRVEKLFSDKLYWLKCSQLARKYAVENFSAPVIAEIYKQKFIREIERG